MLFGNFDIDSVSTPDGTEPRERLALTMSPVGLKMRLRDRNAAAREHSATCDRLL
jgi:hypothetical protein